MIPAISFVFFLQSLASTRVSNSNNALVADKDWEDIKFGVDNQVDFYAVSFVKDAKVVHELKNYLKSNYFFNPQKHL